MEKNDNFCLSLILLFLIFRFSRVHIWHISSNNSWQTGFRFHLLAPAAVWDSSTWWAPWTTRGGAGTHGVHPTGHWSSDTLLSLQHNLQTWQDIHCIPPFPPFPGTLQSSRVFSSSDCCTQWPLVLPHAFWELVGLSQTVWRLSW